ncbi:MAG: Flp pilus assembly complex ATPase component TadA [Phycisphaeraceae bacterium]|nr:Flp pilus assembly complex ATPase component TadA [Phycisphaeraceae bacterium]
MMMKRWTWLAILVLATAAWAQTSVTEVLTAADPTGTTSNATPATAGSPKEIAAAFFKAVAEKDWPSVERLSTADSFRQFKNQWETELPAHSAGPQSEVIQSKLSLVYGSATADDPLKPAEAQGVYALLMQTPNGWKVATAARGDSAAARAAFADFIKAHSELGSLPPEPARDDASAAGPGKADAITAPAGPSTESVMLLSLFKPITFLIILALWGFVAGRVDKDLANFHFPREPWNGAIIGSAVIAFFLWLLLPYFWLGLPVALIILAGTITGYAFYRNPRVPENKQWTLTMNFLTERLEKRSQDQAQSAATVKVVGADGKAMPVPQPDDPTGPAHEAVETLLDFALSRRADRIELMADAQQTSQAVMIDGVRYNQPNLQTALGLGVIDYLKSAAKLDLSDRRRKQVGRVMFEDEANHRHPFILHTMGSTKGLILTLQQDKTSAPALPANQLGLLELQRQQLVACLDQPGRVVIVSSPPGQGQTTTLYSLMGRHDPYTQSVIALEESLEYELEGVTHDKLGPGADADTINQKLKASMLREAQVVMLSKIADVNTAKMMVDYSETTRFYTGIRAEDSTTALKLWVKTLGDTKSAAKGIQAIIAQRLIRRLCKTCRIPYKPDAEVLRKLNLTPDKVGQFYKHSGQVMIKEEAKPCPDCLGLGFKGRTGLFEVMVFDDEARQLLAAGHLDPLRSYLRKQKMLWLQEAALMKVVEGETSIGEVTRIMGGGK